MVLMFLSVVWNIRDTDAVQNMDDAKPTPAVTRPSATCNYANCKPQCNLSDLHHKPPRSLALELHYSCLLVGFGGFRSCISSYVGAGLGEGFRRARRVILQIARAGVCCI